MSKSPNQKLKLLYMKDFLEKYTDAEHPATIAQIISWLEQQGISAERKSVYGDLEALATYGMALESRRAGSVTVWYVAGRDFQLPELKLLVDSVQASRFITGKKSMNLIRKLENLTSVYEGQGLRRQVWVKNRIKSMNESIYYIIDDIHAAIAADRRIRFRYFRYTVSGKREFRREGKYYEISPYALLWDDENYYLIGYDAEAGIIKHFRADKMMNLRMTEEKRQGRELAEKLDMGAYTDSHFGMFSGDTVPVRLRFSNELAGAVIDRFGQDTIRVPDGEEHFTLTVKVVVREPFFGWLCGFGDKAQVLGPESVVKAMGEHVRRIAALYGN